VNRLVKKKVENHSNELQKIEWQIGEAHYCLDKKSVSFTAPTKNPIAAHGKEAGALMTAYGLIKGSPGISTVGVTRMSQPNSKEKGWIVRWKDIREVKFNSTENLVMLKEKLFTGGLGGGLGTYRIQCTAENYQKVASACQAFYNQSSKT
jgi:hypothetical protein